MDRLVLESDPQRVVEGLAIAARAIGAEEIYLYLRGEFGAPWRVDFRRSGLVRSRFEGSANHDPAADALS